MITVQSANIIMITHNYLDYIQYIQNKYIFNLNLNDDKVTCCLILTGKLFHNNTQLCRITSDVIWRSQKLTCKLSVCRVAIVCIVLVLVNILFNTLRKKTQFITRKSTSALIKFTFVRTRALFVTVQLKYSTHFVYQIAPPQCGYNDRIPNKHVYDTATIWTMIIETSDIVNNQCLCIHELVHYNQTEPSCFFNSLQTPHKCRDTFDQYHNIMHTQCVTCKRRLQH